MDHLKNRSIIMRQMKNLLNLIQLADSALPVGSVAHSFGLETLIAEGDVDIDNFSLFLESYLHMAGPQEGWGCLQGYRCAVQLASDEERFLTTWQTLNQEVSALRGPHEVRSASEKIGKRLLQLVGRLEPSPALAWGWRSGLTHYGPVFGLVGATLEIDERQLVAVYLQQCVKTFVAAAQKLMPLGQRQATEMVWRLKPDIESVANKIDQTLPGAFPGLPEMASLRHPHLGTRLFIS